MNKKEEKLIRKAFRNYKNIPEFFVVLDPQQHSVSNRYFRLQIRFWFEVATNKEKQKLFCKLARVEQTVSN